jgi:hypothetical protein
LSAVSARPLRAPCVEMKYSKTVRPSRKFAKNRLLNDVTARLGHQTTHASELTHLLTVTARAGVHHQVNRVELLLALVRFERLEHDVRDLIGRVRPDIDDLVVTFAGGDDTLAMLLLDFLDLLEGEAIS